MAKFTKGQSGNPSGRPKGIKDKRTKVANLLMPHSEGLVAKAVELALNGDIQALRLCIERLIPKASNDSVTIQLPELNSINHHAVLAISTEILRSLSGQQIDIAQTKNLVSILAFCKEHAPLAIDQDLEKAKIIWEKLLEQNKNEY